MSLPEKERGPWPAPCPKCGEEAAVSFLRSQTVEVSCPSCGLFEARREEFDPESDTEAQQGN